MSARLFVAAAIALALPVQLGLAQDQPAEPAKTEAAPGSPAPQSAALLTPKPAPHPFSLIAGSWSGGGTISLSSGTRERLRCRARHNAGQGHRSLSLSIRCASDSYKFELSSDLVERRGQIFGRWTEASNNVSGSISGRAAGNRISATARSDAFTAGLSITTSGNRQSVSITPQGVFITGVHVSLTRR